MDRMLFLVAGLALGYGYCKYRTPLPIPCSEPSQPITQGAASALLSVGQFVDRAEPVLVYLADGNVPSPQDLLRLSTQMRG